MIDNRFNKNISAVANTYGGGGGTVYTGTNNSSSNNKTAQSTGNITIGSLYQQKIAIFNDIKTKMNRINNYLDDGYNHFKNGGCVFENKTFVESEIKDCKDTIELIKSKCNGYIQYLEQSKSKYN